MKYPAKKQKNNIFFMFIEEGLIFSSPAWLLQE